MESTKKKKKKKRNKNKKKAMMHNRRGFATSSVLKEKKEVEKEVVRKTSLTISKKKQKIVSRMMNKLRVSEIQRQRQAPTSTMPVSAPTPDPILLSRRRKRISTLEIDSKIESRACKLLRSSNSSYDRTQFERAALWASSRNRSLKQRLVANWLSLESLKFEHDLIRSAMLSTGGVDLESALNYICIHHNELPISWKNASSSSSVVCVEKMKLNQKNNKIKLEREKKEEEEKKKKLEQEKMRKIMEQKNKIEQEKKRIEEEISTTNTILALAEQQERQSRLEFEREEKERKFQALNPREKYNVLSVRTQELRKVARIAKQNGDDLRNVSTQLRDISIQLRELESRYPDLRKIRKEQQEMQRIEESSKEKEEEEEEEVSLSTMFLEESSPSSTSQPSSTIAMTTTTKAPPTILTMVFSASRANPKSVLLEWSSNAFKFIRESIIMNGSERWRVEIKSTFSKVRNVPSSLHSCVSVSSILMPESTYGKTSKIAQNYLALVALFIFYPGDSVYTRFDDSFRDLWIIWLEEIVREAKSSSSQHDQERDMFISDLIEKLRSCNVLSSAAAASGKLEKKQQKRKTRFSRETLNDEKEEEEELEFEHAKLPMLTKREEFLTLVEENQVVVVVGETGSGKSTQIPQYLLEVYHPYAKIICCQPRRVSAISIANRVSNELPDPKLSGYRIRGDSRTHGNRTRIEFVTTGVVLAMLQNGIESLGNVSHLLIDEVHERGVEIDYLLTVLHEWLRKSSDDETIPPPPKIILMSATIDSTKFSEYFSNAPVLKVSGRTYPVDISYLSEVVSMTKYVLEQDSRYARRDFQEDVAVISATEGRHRTVKTVSSVEKVVARIDPAKVNDELIETLIIHLKPTLLVGCTVLVFLPGTASISRLYSRLSSLRIFSKKDKIIKLHSTASKASIRDAFAQCSGVRIVLSTNIAETGVTLPNVNVVIDTGRVKQIAFNERKGIKSLIERFVSKASAKQRAGRAGRVMRGRCYRLYPEDLYENTFVAFDKPEILRTPIDSLLLQVMIGGETRPIHFFESAVDPPERSKIRAASLRLRGLGLIEISSDDNEFTIKLEDLGSCRVLPLGIACARVPTDLKVAKFLLTASLLGHDVLESAAVLAATLESRNPFLSPSEKRNEADVARSKFNADAHSDSLSVLHAFEAWNQNKRSKKFCKKNFLSPLALLEISKTRDHLLKSIEKSGFIGSSTSFSRDIDKRDRLLRACLVSAFFPNIVAVEKPRECDKTRTWIKRDGSHVYMHPSSLNHSNRLSEMHVAGRTMLWCVFVEFFKTSREFIRDSTLCEAMSCALLCGGERRIIHTKHRLIVDDWMEFAASARTASIIKRLSVMFQDLFRERLRTVESDGDVVDKSCDVSSSRSSGGDSVLDLVVEILSEKPSEDVIFNRGV